MLDDVRQILDKPQVEGVVTDESSGGFTIEVVYDVEALRHTLERDLELDLRSTPAEST